MVDFEIHRIAGNELYMAEDLRKNNPAYFIGCSKTIRNIIGRKDIPEDMVVYATKSKKGWTKSTADIKRANLFLRTEWVKNNFEVSNEIQEAKEPRNYETAPPILDLLPDERFKDVNNNEITIETRGQRRYDMIYFRALDIEKGFDCSSLRKTVLSHEFRRGVHYQTFIRTTSIIINFEVFNIYYYEQLIYN